MENVWDIYEHMNEVVTVSDVETHEVVYMNEKARKKHGISSIDDFKDKKCYEILHKSPYVCTCCKTMGQGCTVNDDWLYVSPDIGKPFLYKDTFLEKSGRRYRLELAVDDIIDRWQQHEEIREHIDIEQIVNDGLRISMSAITPDDSINSLIEYIGNALKCDRIYIFEEERNSVVHCYSNTYEWCREGIIPYKDNLQKIPDSDISVWLDHFMNNENIISADIDELKFSDPVLYQYLKPQEIQSIVVSPLIFGGTITGFFGVDNPPKHYMANISTLFMIMGHFITSQLRRRDLFDKLAKLSFYDELTGAGNRHLMIDYMDALDHSKSIGLVYCDVTGLKRVNDTLGHVAGDALLVRSCKCLRNTFLDYPLFRLGGDEFLILCSGISQEELAIRADQLRASMPDYNVVLAVGTAWNANGIVDMDKLLASADEQMYSSKRQYYKEHPLANRS